MTEPDLFVVCKNCSAEVSPYVTECPYCGQRVRKRAPKIGRDGTPEEPRGRRRARLPRLRGDEIPGIAPEGRPYATFAVVAVCLVLGVAVRIDPLLSFDLGLYGPPGDEWWRVALAPLLHGNLGYLFVAMLATGIFGMHLEQRFGPAVVPVLFLAAGVGGAALSAALGAYPALGANGAALGLLAAWLVDDRRASRRGHERGSDLLGTYVIAAVLALVALAEPEASFVAAAGGAVIGALAGLILG
ncbi:MAG TPA: rhomboid family intramembrane serine protease, partial [Thermoleophilaceae bacterium]|nr:rhomboid family intramembrane serine protease [Thermoleophilaceae bacterium]